MSDEVKRLCNVIIAHVADGKIIFEKDHATMIDTMRSQQAEIERLRAHIRTMQGYVQEYLEPIPYVAKHGAGGTFNEPHRHQDEAHAYFMRQEMREAVLNDLIHMLDGPEERALMNRDHDK